jgi:hypothetical protein
MGHYSTPGHVVGMGLCSLVELPLQRNGRYAGASAVCVDEVLDVRGVARWVRRNGHGVGSIRRRGRRHGGCCRHADEAGNEADGKSADEAAGGNG